MNRYCVNLFRSKWFPIFLVAFLMLIHFLSGYPGGMTPDSFGQFTQSLSFKFNSHHPPLMAMLWHYLNYIYTGPQMMLLFHLSLLWASVLFLYYADDSNKYRWLYFVMPFVPNVLAHSTMIWKDIALGNSFFFVFSGCVYYLYKKEKAPLWVSFIFLLIAFYALSVKFQAQFIIPVLVFLIVTISTNKNLLFRVCATAILSLILIFGNAGLISQFSVNSNSWQLRQFFDIASIVKDIDDDSMLPEYVKNSDIYNFETLKKNAKSKWVDDLIYSQDKVYVGAQDKEQLALLDKCFKDLVLSHPFLYLKHRAVNFALLMVSFYDPKRYSINEYNNELESLGVNVTTQVGFLKSPLIFALTIYPNILRVNIIALALIVIYISAIYKNRKPLPKENLILSYVILIAIIFSVTLFFATMASDYRYYYIVRLLSFFAIPIYLKVRMNIKLDANTPVVSKKVIKL